MRFVLLFLVACSIGCSIGCSTSAKHDDATTMPPPPPEAPRVMPKVAIATSGGEVTVAVEVVATEAKIQRGLMYRQHLPPDEGMLFLMGGDHALEREGWPFWMHNTLIPLDIIWIDKAMTIVEIVENARPRDDTEVGGHVPSRFVLEVNGGYVAQKKIAKGSKVRFDGVR